MLDCLGDKVHESFKKKKSISTEHLWWLSIPLITQFYNIVQFSKCSDPFITWWKANSSYMRKKKGADFVFHANLSNPLCVWLFFLKSVCESTAWKKKGIRSHLTTAWSRNDCATSFEQVEWNMWWNKHWATPSSSTDPDSNCKQATTPETRGNTQCTPMCSHKNNDYNEMAQ